jgi:hypothetical protein
VELIGGETTNTYLQTSIAQSNHGSRGMSPAIQSNQDVYVCGPMCWAFLTSLPKVDLVF